MTEFAPGTILSAETKSPIPFDELLADLKTVGVVYVGEKHTQSDHHKVQLKVLKTLSLQGTPVALGMEMFDRTYQPVLDAWSAGNLETEEFIKKTHWYANWRYDFELYRDILELAKSRQIPVYALNIPFHIPPKIAIGGSASLNDWERSQLPQTIDTSNPEHRAYLEEVFTHHNFKRRKNFEDFYEAQCVWEDIMAESIANHLDRGIMVVLAGSGHIQNKYGIPDRAHALTNVPFRTIIPMSGEINLETDLSKADYIWITG